MMGLTKAAPAAPPEAPADEPKRVKPASAPVPVDTGSRGRGAGASPATAGRR